MNDPPATDRGPRRLWTPPRLVIVPVNLTEGDPTTSDDGLGDGLFSIH